MIKMIMALGRNNELGSSTTPDGLPWKRNSEDMKYFKGQTLGNVVVYGGNTFRQFQKMGMEFGLPDRINWVLTGTRGAIPFSYNLCAVSDISKLEQGLNLYKTTEDLWVTGGKSIYDQLHPYAEEVHLTRINQDYPDADVYLDTRWLCDFEKVKEVPLNDYSHVEIYKRKEK